MTDHYAVIGNPIAHSKSPLIHSEFANQTGQAMVYEAILAPLDDFAGTVQALIKQGYKGVNVTVPFKFADTTWRISVASGPWRPARLTP